MMTAGFVWSACKMKVLVTGAAGRLGSVVAKHLAELGIDVRATDVRSRAGLAVPVVCESLLLSEACYRLTEGVDALVHLANHANVSVRPPQVVYGENCTMNGNILQAALDMGVRRVIFSSTIQTVTGDPSQRSYDALPRCILPYLPMDDSLPIDPANFYSASKIAAEELLKAMCRHDGMHAVVLRFPMLINGREIAFFIERNRRRGLRSSGDAWGRHEVFAFLRVDDAASLIAAVLRTPWTGYRCSLPADARTSLGLTPRDAYEQHLSDIPLRVPIDELHALVDCSSLQREFGWVQPGRDEAIVTSVAAAT
jgi:nucleoside-diphosphate-sugar epimerase